MELDKRVKFGKVTISKENRDKLRAALSKNKTLKALKLNQCDLTNGAVEAFCKFLNENTTLERVFLGKSSFSEEALSDVFRALGGNKTLSGFNFRDSPLTDETASAVCKFILQNKTVEDLWFQNSTFNDGGMVKIMSALLGNKTLTALNFNSSKLTSQTADAIAKFISENTTMKEMWFQKAAFTDDGLSKVLTALCGNDALLIVNLNGNDMTDAMADSLSTCFRDNKKLTELWLQSSKFTDKGLSGIFKALSSNASLSEINLNHSTMTDEVADSFSSFALHNQKMIRFCCQGSTFTDKGFSKLLQFLEANRTLLEISLDVQLADDWVDPLLGFLGTRKTVKRVWQVGGSKSKRTIARLEIMKSDVTGPLEFYMRDDNGKKDIVGPPRQLQKELKKWLDDNAVPSAIGVAESKLALFVSKKKEETIRDSLSAKMKTIDTPLKDEYKIETVSQDLEIWDECSSGKGALGSKILFHCLDTNDECCSTAGAIAKDKKDKYYVLSSMHGRSPGDCYLEVGGNRYKCTYVGDGITDKSRIDACLLEVDGKELKPENTSFLTCEGKKIAFYGPEASSFSDIADKKKNEVPVKKYGATTKLKEGKLVYFSVDIPWRNIEDGLLVVPTEEVKADEPFTAEGDSGCVLFREGSGKEQEGVVLQEALGIHSYGVSNVPNCERSCLAFRLDRVLEVFKQKHGRDLHLVPMGKKEGTN